MTRKWGLPLTVALAVFFTFLLFQETVAQGVSVDPVSGRALVSVPIYTLTYGTLSVPVNLSHSGNALQVQEAEGDAGLGWNLTCNYGVYRQVRGLPDDLNPSFSSQTASVGWLNGTSATAVANFASQSPDNLTSYSTGESADFTAINNLGYLADTEPDLYTVVAPGLYFQFVYDAGRKPRLLNYQDVKLTTLSNGTGFTVQNNIGQTFQFTTAETVSRKSSPYKGAVVDMFQTEFKYYSPTSISFAKVWYLTSATDPAGRAISFAYTKVAPVTSNAYRSRINATVNITDTLYYTQDSFTPMALSTIKAGNYSISFSWSSSNLLSSITVSETGLGDTFKYGFVYQQAQSSGNLNPPFYVHSFLRQITPINTSTCMGQVPYKFTYQGVGSPPTSYPWETPVNMPWNTFFSQDLWGYYNGYTGPKSTQGVPQLYYDANQTDSRRFSFQPLANSNAVILNGSNRFVSASNIGIGSLVQISYPTGGSTKIVWERNKYYDTLANQVVFGPGLRVASLITDGGEAAFGKNANEVNAYHQIIKNYTYTRSDADTTTSGLALYPPEYGFATGNRFIKMPYDLSTGSYVTYRRVKETTSQGSKVFVYAAPAMYPAISYSTDWKASKSKIARNPATKYPLINVQNGYYTFPFAPNPNYGFSQGLLSSVSEFSTTGALVRQKKYVYSRISPSLQSVYGLKFEYLNSGDCDCFHFSKYQIITGTTNVLTQEISTEVSEANSLQVDKVVTYYHYNNDITNNNFLMDSVRTVWGDGSVSRKKIRYVKDFASIKTAAPGDVMAGAIVAMIAGNSHGEEVEQFTTYQAAGGNQLVTGANLKLFQVFKNGKVYPFKTFTFPEGGTFTPAVATTGTTQGFSFNLNYLLSASFNDFDAAGNAVSMSDNKQNKVAYHYPLNYSLTPVATIANATASQTVYEGFEFTTGRNLAPAASLSMVAGWTGQKAATLTATNSLSNTSVANAAVPYRVSCYIRTTQNANITFQFLDPSNNTTVSSTVLTCTTLNKWVNLEGVLPSSSSFPATLALKVSSNVTVYLDDIFVIPQQASVSLQTYLPLKGLTSQTDDRGNSTTITYDAIGRKTRVFDRQRNLIEFNEYQVKGAIGTFLSSFFSYSTPTAGIPFTATNFSSIANCFSSITYEWRLDGDIVGTNSPLLTTTSSTPGAHNLQLQVLDNITQEKSVTNEKIIVKVNSTPPVFSFITLPPNNTVSNTSAAFKYVISDPILGCGGTNASFYTLWYISTDGGATYKRVSNGHGTNNSITIRGPVPGFLLKATVYQTCSTTDSMNPDATDTSTSVVEEITVANDKGN